LLTAIRLSYICSCQRFPQTSRRKIFAPLVVMSLGPVLASCASAVSNGNPSTLMVDCQFRANNHIHMHVAEERGSVTLVTGYTPGEESTHFEDLRKGIESKGRLMNSAGYRLAIEMYLLNDHFGENPGDVVRIQVAGDGRSLMQAKGAGGVVRTIDTGTCTLPEAMTT
jgi:hypothetical protein